MLRYKSISASFRLSKNNEILPFVTPIQIEAYP